MTDFFDVAALGARIRLAFDDDVPGSAVEAVRASWIDATSPGAAEPDAVVSVTTHRAPDATAETLTIDVTLAALQHHRGELLMFHAAGVADERGRVAAFVGPSGRGKTTLSRTLGQQFGYVSDETIGVEPDGRVLPYRKPLSVVRAGAPKDQVAPSAFGMRDIADLPLQLSTITILDRDADVDSPTIEAVDFCDAVAEIIPQMSYFAELPTPLQTLARLVEHVGGFTRLRYSDAESVTPLVSTLLDHHRAAESWHPIPVPQAALLDGQYSASDVIDAVRFGDRTAIFIRGRIQVLGGIAPTVWEALCAGRNLDGIVDEVIAEFGAPPDGDPRAIVQATIDELVHAGILSPTITM